MTSSRLARGGKGRIFIYLGAILLLAGVIAIFHNSQQQFDDLKKNEQLCQHQQESLLAQMQVIIEYKARLEKSLQTERANHLQSQNALEAKVHSEKLLREKHDNEDNVRLTTLQQHYKLLKSQHEDLEEECANTNEKHLSEISDLKRKIEEISKDLKSYQGVKFETLQKLESENKQLLIEKNNLQSTLNAKQIELNQINDKLKKEIYHLQKQLDSKCDGLDIEKLRHSSLLLPTPNKSQRKSRVKLFPVTQMDFNKQVQLKKDVYQIRTNEDKPIDPSIQTQNLEKNDGSLAKLISPYSSSTNKQNKENVLNALQVPNALSSSTSTSPKNYNNLVIQTSTLSHLNKDIDKDVDKSKVKTNSVLNKTQKSDSNKKVNKNVPAGVLPIPPETGDSRTLPNQIEVNEVKNSQFGSIVKHSVVNGDETSIEKENVAHEVLEDNVGEIPQLKVNANDEANLNPKFNDGIQNNAEEDMYDNKNFPLVHRPVLMNDKANVKVEDSKNANNGAAMGAPDLYEDEQREMSLEEPEDDDIDDYGHDNKNQIAVRN